MKITFLNSEIHLLIHFVIFNNIYEKRNNALINFVCISITEMKIFKQKFNTLCIFSEFYKMKEIMKGKMTDNYLRL